MHAKIKKLILLLLISVSLVFIKSATLAQTTAQTPQTIDEVQSQQKDLQKQLQDITNQINQYTKDIKKLQGQKKTLQNKIAQLKKQAAALVLKIKATSLQIDQLKTQINKTENSISANVDKISNLRDQLSSLILVIYKLDNHSTLFPFFGANNFSDVFIEMENYLKITEGINKIVGEIKSTNETLSTQREDLDAKKTDTQHLFSIQTLEQQNLLDSVTEQNTVLKVTKGKESNYQTMLADSKKRAAEIRNRLYQLFEVEKQINFGQAVSIAGWAGGQTGVRAAFLLAILTQESNLGKNVGTCNRAGDPPSKSYKVVMNPTRDQPPFLIITANLGRNPDVTPISCPMRDSKGNQVGWGGAMGPAQFIPSTWMGYKDKVTAITGNSADPWDIRDAFMASAIKLAADGGTSKSGEWAAAMRYFSGSTNTRYRFYGDSVVAQAEKYQADIDEINK